MSGVWTGPNYVRIASYYPRVPHKIHTSYLTTSSQHQVKCDLLTQLLTVSTQLEMSTLSMTSQLVYVF